VRVAWARLTRVNFAGRAVLLSVGRYHAELIFDERELRPFLQRLADILARLFSTAELLRLHWPMRPRGVASEFGCLCRLLGEAGRAANRRDVRLLGSRLLSNCRWFSLAECADPLSLFPTVCKILPMWTALEALHIASPADASRALFLLAHAFAGVASSVRFLRDQGEVCLFSAFLAKLAQKVQLKGLSLCLSILAPSELMRLRNYVLGAQLEALEFHFALEADTEAVLVTDFLMPPIDQHLRSLSLAGTTEIALTDLFEVVPYLHHLTVEKCQYRVLDVLRYACAKESSLRMIVISGNEAPTKAPDFRIPNRLKAVVIDDMEMANPALLLFLLRNLPAHSFLLMRRARIGKAPWHIWMGTETLRSSRIASLRLDGSPIGLGFIGLLNSCTELTSLSLSYCLSETDVDLITAFGSFVQSSPFLRRLTVRSNGDEFFGRTLPGFFKALLGSARLEDVDISGHCCRAETVVELEAFFKRMRSNLSFLVIDGSLIAPAALLSLFDFVIRENLTSRLSFPAEDLWAIVGSHKITPAHYKSYADHFFWTSRIAREIRALPESAIESPPDKATSRGLAAEQQLPTRPPARRA
jgi:hypothetical protein